MMDPFPIRQEVSKPNKDTAEAGKAARGLHPRIVAKGRNFLRASELLRQSTEKAWRTSQWSGADPIQRERDIRAYHEALELYRLAEGQFSAALGGGVHTSELELALAQDNPPSQPASGNDTTEAAAG